MNERQHQALNNRDRTAAHVNIARDQLARALRELSDAEDVLKLEVDHDKGSWYGTPGIER